VITALFRHTILLGGTTNEVTIERSSELNLILSVIMITGVLAKLLHFSLISFELNTLFVLASVSDLVATPASVSSLLCLKRDRDGY
jgi:hypothetical protein